MKKLALIKIDSEEQTMELGIVSGEELNAIEYMTLGSKQEDRERHRRYHSADPEQPKGRSSWKGGKNVMKKLQKYEGGKK